MFALLHSIFCQENHATSTKIGCNLDHVGGCPASKYHPHIQVNQFERAFYKHLLFVKTSEGLEISGKLDNHWLKTELADKDYMIDITQTLKDTENSLRDFISLILNKNLGTGWDQKCGVSEDRLNKWKERKEAEKKRQESGATDERLIYYADFYDLKTIFKKHWVLFSCALGDLKTFEVWMSELEKLRDPDAHRRELLPHQKNLILGLSGEIRTKIARYRSSQETSDSYYPRIEFAADNLGNSWKVGDDSWINTGMKLRPTDVIEFVVTASDPLEEQLQYQCTLNQGSPGHSEKWTSKNSFTCIVTEEHVGKLFFVSIAVRSSRKFHAHKTYDASIKFDYEVLPPKI
jgi:hypothetical protein